MALAENRSPSGARRVLAVLVRHPDGLSRQALASAADVSSSTLASMLREDGTLVQFVIELKAAHAASGGGPRPKIVRLRDGICVAGVEIGHGHVRIGFAGLDGRLWPDDDGREYEQVVMPVFKERRRTLNWIAGGSDGDGGALSRRLAKVFARRSEETDRPMLTRPFVVGVGISVAAPVDPIDGRLVAVRPSDGLILKEEEGSIACADWDGESAGQGLRDRLRGSDQTEMFGWSVSHFRSDSASELCARAELHDGELSRSDLAIFIKWTGNVSAAVILDGNAIVGSRGLAGGFPLHSPLGNQDDRAAGIHEDPRKRLPLGVAVGIRRLGKEIGEALGVRKKENDELLRDYFRAEVLSIARGESAASDEKAFVNGYLGKAATLLGENLAPAVDMLNPSKVVIGGGVFQRRDWPIVAESMSEGIRANIVAPSNAPEVTLAHYEEHPALQGAIASRLNEDSVVTALVEGCEQMAVEPLPLEAAPGTHSLS